MSQNHEVQAPPATKQDDYLFQQLARYAAYHRDRRNIYTHFLGIPLIVLAMVILLSHPLGFDWGGLTPTWAWVGMALSMIYYQHMGWRIVWLMLIYYALNLALAPMLLEVLPWTWWKIGIGLFVIGWIFQFIGHYFEGRKPAFFDDLRGLLAGPLFVIMEWLFLLGLAKKIQLAITLRLQQRQ